MARRRLIARTQSKIRSVRRAVSSRRSELIQVGGPHHLSAVGNIQHSRDQHEQISLVVGASLGRHTRPDDDAVVRSLPESIPARVMKLLTSRTEGFSLNGSHAGTSLPNDPFARVSMSGRATSRTAGRPLPVSRHRRLQRRYDRET